MYKFFLTVLLYAGCLILPQKKLHAQLATDTSLVQEALEFYKLAPLINADLVAGDTCQARLKRERFFRERAEKGQYDLRKQAAIDANNFKSAMTTKDKTLTWWQKKYSNANTERWVYRGITIGGLGVLVVKIFFLQR